MSGSEPRRRRMIDGTEQEEAVVVRHPDEIAFGNDAEAVVHHIEVNDATAEENALYAELRAATSNLIEATQAQAVAASALDEAMMDKNLADSVLTNAQQQMDQVMTRVKRAAPYSSDWGRGRNHARGKNDY